MNASPAAIASGIRKIGPLLAVITGVALTSVGRGGLGFPLIAAGVIWWARNRNVGRISPTSPRQSSTVRSAWLEMRLDHETGELDGLVLTGLQEGQLLSAMAESDLLDLYADLNDDQESAALMEAYLDRRIPSWRENADPREGSGQGSTAGSGPMTKEEAYQILGLVAGASTEEIRAAHRKLMKAVHPDSGGSTFLAARINEAKDTLLD
ncbi:MAG: DnaJ domain-containing protein [Pseudomonadota bacterium]